MIVAVALLGRGNGPLYLRAFGDHAKDDLRFHFIAHAALDQLDDKLAARRAAAIPLPAPHIRQRTFHFILQAKPKLLA